MIRPNMPRPAATAAAVAAVAALTTAIVPSAVAGSTVPAPATGAAEHHHQDGQPLPPLEEDLLAEAIAGLPNHTVTSAQVKVSGTEGRWSGTSGVADIETDRPVPADASYRIGSATKMFTAVVVLQLAAEERLDLDDSVQQHLPDLLPPSYPDVTVRQLLNHTSGLPISQVSAPAQDPAWFVQHRFEGWSTQEVLDSAFAQAMEFAPGTRQRYNGVNYFIAGLLVEKVSEHSFRHEVYARILRPLGLHRTYVPREDDVELHGRHAHGYVDVDGELVDITEQSPWSWAEGGMVSSTRDLTRFLEAAFEGRLLPPAEQAELFSVPDVEYAGDSQCSVGPDAGRACFSAGLQRTTFPNGVTVWGKSGSVPGYTTAAFATRDLQRTLVFSLTPTGNRDGSEIPYVQHLAGAAFDPDLVTGGADAA